MTNRLAKIPLGLEGSLVEWVEGLDTPSRPGRTGSGLTGPGSIIVISWKIDETSRHRSTKPVQTILTQSAGLQQSHREWEA